jgi:hypothetical protein
MKLLSEGTAVAARNTERVAVARAAKTEEDLSRR